MYILKPEKAESISKYTEDFYAGQPAITVNKSGKGLVYYIGTEPEQKLIDDFLADIVNESGIERIYDTPAEVEFVRRRTKDADYIFALNHTGKTQIINCKDNWKSIINNEKLEPYGYALFMAERRKACNSLMFRQKIVECTKDLPSLGGLIIWKYKASSFAVNYSHSPLLHISLINLHLCSLIATFFVLDPAEYFCPIPKLQQSFLKRQRQLRRLVATNLASSLFPLFAFLYNKVMMQLSTDQFLHYVNYLFHIL